MDINYADQNRNYHIFSLGKIVNMDKGEPRFVVGKGYILMMKIII